MGRIVGIDLGTTYSAVAIPEVREGEGFMPIRECPGCSIILDRHKRRITPSVVAENEKGEIVVGHSAKARAGLSPEPIMFAKRSMGEDKTFQLSRKGALSPEQVSAEILKYLKKMAEEQLGDVVDEAVITVPAYFNLRAKQMTEKAGELAGLSVAQIAQEPVAAALMYCAGDVRDPLRIMTYDLGGGTFDVAILEKRDGVISGDSVLAFDGDRFLGGYDFDNLLALWIMDQLCLRGYDLKLDLKNPADRVIFAKLMIYAERAKIDLSKKEIYEFQEPNTGIIDHAGTPITLEQLELTREQFEAMISKKVDGTIDICRRAMTQKANPNIRPEDIDELVMVGGSSRIPLVGRRLREAFGKDPRLVEPDLCIALGAAILAGTKSKAFGRFKLDPIPAETDAITFTVTGTLTPGAELSSVGDCKVTLWSQDGGYKVVRLTTATGAFVFKDVPLEREDTREFILTVTTPAGVEVTSHRFTVRQTQAVRRGGLILDVSVSNVLAKPIGVQLKEGFHIVAPERTPLPFEKMLQCVTKDGSGRIIVPVVEENSTLGEITMTNIPVTLPIGSAVELTLTFQEDYHIRGRAYVPSLGREAKVVIEIPVPRQRTLEELRREYEDLHVRAEDARLNASRGDLFTKGQRLNNLLAEVAEMLPSRSPELAKIQDRIEEIKTMVRELGTGWKPEPPRAVFNEKADEAEDLLAAAIKERPEVAKDGYDRKLAAIRAEAEKAFAKQNTAAWKEAFEQVVKLCDEIAGLNRKPTPPADPATILLMLARGLVALQADAEAKNIYAALKADFEDAAAALKQINPKDTDVMVQIRDWYYSKLEELRKKVSGEKSGLGDKGWLGLSKPA